MMERPLPGTLSPYWVEEVIVRVPAESVRLPTVPIVFGLHGVLESPRHVQTRLASLCPDLVDNNCSLQTNSPAIPKHPHQVQCIWVLFLELSAFVFLFQLGKYFVE